ncbi:marR family transcriptional regulator [Bordetella pertussis]|nr:marR family transcriptional regulator [Bordetella pertussis]
MIDTPDLETRAAPEDHHALRLWLRMLTCCNLIESEIRSRLRTEFDTTLPRFDLMAQLQRAPKGMKMGELSRHMMVTNGNITGITDQLEKEGLVVRTKVESDRRSSVLKLTPQGKRTFARMARAHESWVTGMLDDLPEASRHAMYKALGELKL